MVWKFETTVARAVCTVTPVSDSLLLEHETRWALLHPTHLAELQKHYREKVSIRQQSASGAIEQMIATIGTEPQSS